MADFKDEFKAKNEGKEELKLAVEPRRDLENNWIDVMRGKSALQCNEDLGCATMVAIKMAVESYRQHKTLLWDAERKRSWWGKSLGGHKLCLRSEATASGCDFYEQKPGFVYLFNRPRLHCEGPDFHKFHLNFRR